VHQLEREDEVELIMFGADGTLPDRATVADRCGSLLLRIEAGEAPDDWGARRALIHRPVIVAGRLLVRPSWAPAAPDGLVEVVLGEDSAFGTGSHPTTHTCLELIADMPAGESLADLGCGSGVLAIAACRFGWGRVHAIDHDPASVAATRCNARLNAVRVGVERRDLTAQPPPAADVIVANVPGPVHAGVAGRLAQVPRTLIATGFAMADLGEIAVAYAKAGLRVEDRLGAGGWASLVLTSERGR
jgi:ribosomal protein L11 methyltransferase